MSIDHWLCSLSVSNVDLATVRHLQVEGVSPRITMSSVSPRGGAAVIIIMKALSSSWRDRNS